MKDYTLSVLERREPVRLPALEVMVVAKDNEAAIRDSLPKAKALFRAGYNKFILYGTSDDGLGHILIDVLTLVADEPYCSWKHHRENV